ncbi:hypothetical protein V6N13_016883 [Hibiscus sabdariffa]|uniref:Uncharacterized protein n=1 Tax=Hibiscus sabdariffa TaxID=183260 RepID=A0ABR2PUC4_9ROSI
MSQQVSLQNGTNPVLLSGAVLVGCHSINFSNIPANDFRDVSSYSESENSVVPHGGNKVGFVVSSSSFLTSNSSHLNVGYSMCLWGKIREILEGDRELSSESEDSTSVLDELNSSLDPEFEAMWDLSKILEISFKGGREAVLLRLCEIEKELRSGL